MNQSRCSDDGIRCFDFPQPSQADCCFDDRIGKMNQLKLIQKTQDNRFFFAVNWMRKNFYLGNNGNSQLVPMRLEPVNSCCLAI